MKTEKGDMLHVVQPLKDGEVGYVHLGFRWAPVDSALRRACWNFTIVMLSALLLSALLAAFIYRRLAHPIEELTQAARRFGEGKLTTRVRERPGAGDEAELLAQAFNQMAARIEQQVNDLVHSHAELADKEAWVQALLNSMPQAILVIGPRHEVIYSNSAAREMSSRQGKAAAEGCGAFCTGHPEIQRALEKRESRRIQCRLNERDFIIALSPVQGPDGESLGVVLIATDVSDQMKAGRMLAHAEKLNVVGQLAAGIAHQIISPLDGALEASKIIEQNARNPAKVGQFARAQHAALERIAVTIRRLLTFSRQPAAGEHRPVSISKVIREAQGILNYRFVRKRLRLDVRQPEEDVFAVGDELNLIQVLVNLINNAIDVTPEEGVIRIEAAAGAGTLSLSVTDQGGGIPPRIAGRLFTPFFTTKEVGKGTGLGLAVTRNLVQEHGGTIAFANLESPWGARFSVTLPRDRSAVAPGLGPSSPAAPQVS